MQVTETSAAGLKREFRVVVPATDLQARVNERLDDLKGRVQLRGFRPGKVPVAHLRRLYGKAAMAEVIEAAVREANSKIVTDHGFKLAIEPKVVLPSEEGAVEGVIAGKSDLAYTVEIEILPPITLADFKTIKLTRLTAEVTDAEIDQTLQRIAEQNRPFIAKSEGAEKGDRVILSFQGTIEGKPFEGGAAEDVPMVLGASQFIPGFEDHLMGLKAGESRTFDVKFPDNYPAKAVAGKDATFAVTAKAVEAPGAVKSPPIVTRCGVTARPGCTRCAPLTTITSPGFKPSRTMRNPSITRPSLTLRYSTLLSAPSRSTYFWL